MTDAQLPGTDHRLIAVGSLPVSAVVRRVPRIPPRRWGLAALVAGTVLFAVFIVWGVILPGYRRPTTRTYGTSVGYPSVLRRLGRPLPIETAMAEERRIVRSFLGEGTIASDPVQVPMLPAARVIGVYVQPGQRVHKGELLAELDSRRGKLAADSARLAFESAKAELRRVQMGSLVLLNREQPAQDVIDVGALEKELGLLRDEVATKETLYGQGLVSKDRYLDARRTLQETEHALDTASLSLGVSATGKRESEHIATDAMRQAALQWQQALAEFEEYEIVAPADGIVDRVLIHQGEFNQTAGTTAFVVASGLWFEAYFDQTAVDDVVDDTPAEIHLSARPDRTFSGRVASVNPVVSYTTGGPESARPAQPVMTVGPEWAATFQVRIELPTDVAASLAPGLTGFVRVTREHRGVAVPAAAMMSVSGGNGLLAVMDGDTWHVRRARYGTTTGGWLEIFDGVAAGEKVIVAGQEVLHPGDRIRESSWKPSAGGL
jgi:multidrug resistance efflux pump